MGIEVHTDHSEFHMSFRIEQQSDGTFLGVCDKPHMEIKGATREEVMQKIKDSLGSRLLEKLGMEATASTEGSGIQIKVNKRMTITKTNADGTKTEVFSSGGSSPAELSGTAPATPAPFEGASSTDKLQAFLRALLGLALLIGLAWWFFHR
jgi:hypothetical protein